MILVVHSLAETEQLAASMAQEVSNGARIGLCGELGVGKTHFAKAFAKALGVTEEVVSPTFIIENVYQTNRENVQLHHVDLYRIKEWEEFWDIPTDDILLVEWAEVISEIYEKLDAVITIKYLAGETEGREIQYLLRHKM